MDKDRRTFWVVVALVVGVFVIYSAMSWMEEAGSRAAAKGSGSHTRTSSQRHGHHSKTHNGHH